MEKRVPSPFEVAVRTEMIKRGMSQTELFGAIHEKTGLYCDHGYLSKIFRDKNDSPKIRVAIAEILDIDLDKLSAEE